MSEVNNKREIRVKVSNMQPYTDFEGLWTIGVNRFNKSVKVSLNYIKQTIDGLVSQFGTAKQDAERATSAANTAASAASTATTAANTAATAAQGAASSANTAATSAQGAASAANTAANAANNAADAANRAANNAANATQDAVTATNAANNAAENAGSKANEANSAALSANSAAESANSAADKATTSAQAADNATEAAVKATTDAQEATTAAQTATEDAIAARVTLERLVPAAMSVDSYPAHLTYGNVSDENRIEVSLLPETVSKNISYISDNKSVAVRPDGILQVIGRGVSTIHVIPTCNTALYKTIQIQVSDPTVRMATSTTVRLTAGGHLRLT